MMAPATVVELARLLEAGPPTRAHHGFGLDRGEWTVEPSFAGFTDPPPSAAYCLGKRSSCLRDVDGRMSCAEVEIVRRLRDAGWTAGWINTYGGDPPARWLDWMTTPRAMAPELPAGRKDLAEWLGTRGVAAGSPDVIAVRGGDVLAIECKRRGAPGAWSDSVRATQTAWAQAVIVERALVASDELVVVAWTRRDAPVGSPAVPAELEPTRKHPEGRREGHQAAPSRAAARQRPRRSVDPERGEVAITVTEPTTPDRQAALDAVAERGWSRTGAAGHARRPNGWRGPDGGYVPCEVCRARTNPARWPLFFKVGAEAGRTLWGCSTCKLKHADRLRVAIVLVDVSNG